MCNRIQAPPPPKGFPACFDSLEQYAHWFDASRISNDHPAAFICKDCTPGYRAAMLRAHRCMPEAPRGNLIDDGVNPPYLDIRRGRPTHD